MSCPCCVIVPIVAHFPPYYNHNAMSILLPPYC